MKAVILATNKGIKLFPLGLTRAKCMISILNRPLIDWMIKSLYDNKIREIAVVVSDNSLGQQVERYLSSRNYRDLKLTYIAVKQDAAITETVAKSQAYLKNEALFLLLSADEVIGSKDLASLIAQKKSSLLIAHNANLNNSQFGVVQFTKSGKIFNLVKKETLGIGDFVRTNAVLLNQELFQLLTKVGQTEEELTLTDVLDLYVKKQDLFAVEIKDYWLPIVYPWHILDATDVLMSRMDNDIQGIVEDNVVIKGKLVLPKSSIIQSGTYIEGNLMLGENTEIKPYTYFRNSVVIGSNCRIGFATEIKNCVLGNSVKSKHSYIGDSIFSDNIDFPYSVAGNHKWVTINDYQEFEVYDKEQTVKTLIRDKYIDSSRRKLGAVVGDNVKFGIRTILYPGVKIWSNSFTSPGEIVKRDIVNVWK